MAENEWFKHDGGECPVVEGILIDVKYRDGEIKENLPALKRAPGRDAQDAFWYNDGLVNDIVAWRHHKPEQPTLDYAFGQQHHMKSMFEYPQTSFKPSSNAELKAAEATRISNLLSEKIRTIADIASKLTRKNFSVADIKLVKALLESVEEYEEKR